MEGFATLVVVSIVTVGVACAILYILKVRYFASDEFLAHKNAIASFVAEHNAIAGYVAEIRSRGTFDLGASATGGQAHLASFQNTSHWNYRRDRNVANYQAPNVHNCSLQVVRNASADPIKYVMKYFGIKADEAHLVNVEDLGESIAGLEEAISNLQEREASITVAVNPPAFILKFFAKDFMKQVGVELSPITVPYPVYIFEYVSAGGNSSQRTTFTLNSPTIDALVETLSLKIRWKKSAAGQRALMTTRLRNLIKERDNHTCRYCKISLAAEPHLLLEVDHIIPVSRGGMSTEDNLQTLCWRCNRTKSNKVAAA
ncbi:HNH endonuclease [Rhodococcoides yunnanense]|jgi:hypothetical protein|uniref:HNH endonuclease n=2 Tax=Nocardiaceae TaxID=85025 RepID=UPI0022B1B31A|nr:HNH endonuclease signature motif containing protein [Rhodococcus yunnanensis]MCZ4276874.1 HNH endonuclease signature motif containing protein [Rhodococcus yunnanensis]